MPINGSFCFQRPARHTPLWCPTVLYRRTLNTTSQNEQRRDCDDRMRVASSASIASIASRIRLVLSGGFPCFNSSIPYRGSILRLEEATGRVPTEDPRARTQPRARTSSRLTILVSIIVNKYESATLVPPSLQQPSRMS
jgi:hypothetical protein